jgi:hypothetical protein
MIGVVPAAGATVVVATVPGTLVTVVADEVTPVWPAEHAVTASAANDTRAQRVQRLRSTSQG